MNVVVIHPPKGEVAQSGHSPGRNFGLDQVGCKLLANKLVERGVLVQGFNDVISVCVSIRADSVVAIHQNTIFGICKSGHIQPVPAPAFSISWRGQESIQQLLKSLIGGGRIVGKRPHFFPRGRESCEVVSGSSQESSAICRGAGLDP